jgi:hypothetical protein
MEEGNIHKAYSMCSTHICSATLRGRGHLEDPGRLKDKITIILEETG